MTPSSPATMKPSRNRKQLIRVARRQRFRASFECLEDRRVMDANYFNLAGGNFSQDWSNAGLITTLNDWSGVPSIEG